MTFVDQFILYYSAFCVSGAIVCYIRLFIPSWQLLAEVLNTKLSWFSNVIVSVSFIGLCLILGPGMLFILKDREAFIQNYVKNFLEK
jgi:hypothetical protein